MARSEVMPISWATSATVCAPISLMTCAYAVFEDHAVAWARLMMP